MRQSKELIKPLSELRKKYETVFEVNQVEQLNHQITRLQGMLTGLTNKLDQRMKHMETAMNREMKMMVNKDEDLDDDESMEPRFTQLKFYIQKTLQLPQAQRISHLKIFSAELARKIVSKGFVWYEDGKFTDKKFRQFFCNNFLANIVKYAMINKLNQKQLKQLDEHLKKKVLVFLKQKYPQNQSSSSNKKFESMITGVDNFQSNSNDLIHKCPSKFEWKQSGDYSKEIMKFMNYILHLTRDNTQNGKNLFQVYYQQMQEIFKKVENQEWMIRAQRKQFDQKEIKTQQSIGESPEKKLYDESKREQYRKSVKQYTKYAIGQKIPDSVSYFTEQQIEDEYLYFSNPSMIRIMSKWCQQLQKCFSETNIYSRDQRFLMQDGKERYIKKIFRQQLYIEIREQEKKAKQFVEEVKKNIYENQYEIFKDQRCVNSFKHFASQDQQIAGYFAIVMKKSYENYIISYVNQLIHRILSAQKEMKQRYNKKQYYKMATSLISFKVADLLRCKCSSKQSQIIALYNYLKYYCAKNPEKLEIIRVKNRLHEGTKDILINFQFHQKILVEMQLSINQETSNFIKCSDKANHFIYEIERATFGPLSEMCIVYSNVDPRADFLTKQFEVLNQKRPFLRTIPKCAHKIKETSLPLWCSQCNKFVSTLNLITKHIKCLICNYSKCSTCIIRNSQFKSIKVSGKKLSFEDEIKKKTKTIVKKRIQVLNLGRKNEDYSKILLVYYNFKIIFMEDFGQKGVIYMGEAQKQSEFNNFFMYKEILEEESSFQVGENLLMAIHDQLMNLKVRNVNKKMRKYFVFEGLKISQKALQKKRMQTVQIINMNNVHLTSTTAVIKAFPNAKRVLIYKNKIQNLNDIENWKQIKELNLESNRLTTVSKQIQNLKNLQFIVLTKNKFTIFPDELCNLPNLQILNFKENQVERISNKIGQLQKLKNLRLTENRLLELPSQVSKLEQLEEIDCSKNQITVLPVQLKQLKNLKQIYFESNNISSIDDDFFTNMKQLEKVNFGKNKIKNIPSSLKEKSRLIEIDFNSNKLEIAPNFLFNLPSLKELDLGRNEICEVEQQQCKSESLKILDLSKNKIKKMPDGIFQLKNIYQLSIGGNLFDQLPERILNFPNLKQISLEDLKLKQFPTLLFKKELKKISLDQNEISSIPVEINLFKKSLIELRLCSNKFTAFPPQVYQLQMLQTLALSKNQINVIPADVKQLRKLERIEIENMKIKQLPIQLKELKSLRQVFVSFELLESKETLSAIADSNQSLKSQWEEEKKKIQQNNKKKN